MNIKLNINTPVSQLKPVFPGAHSPQTYNGSEGMDIQVLLKQGVFSMLQGPFAARWKVILIKRYCFDSDMIIILIYITSIS